MLRKLLSIVMCIQLLLSVQGFRLFAHYCHGHLRHVSVFLEETCGTECCSAVASSKASCCHKEKDIHQEAPTKTDVCDASLSACCHRHEESDDSPMKTVLVAPSSCCKTITIDSKPLQPNSFRPLIQNPSETNSLLWVNTYGQVALNQWHSGKLQVIPRDDGPCNPKSLTIWHCRFLI